MPRIAAPLSAILSAILLAALLAAPATARADTSLPGTAGAMAAQMDAQLSKLLELDEPPAKGTTLIVTTPVSLDDLDKSVPVARLMAEELTAWFVAAGYRVQEIRRGRDILFQPGKGETLLTRDVQMLNDKSARSAVILAGTYVMTSKSVRFSMRLLHASTGEVLAMSNQTLNLTPETTELVGADRLEQMTRLKPTVATNLTMRAPGNEPGPMY